MMDQNAVLDRYYLDCRCMLLELAATLDRLDRAPPATKETKATAQRLLQLQQAIQIVADSRSGPDRAARILQLLSDPIN